MGAAGSKKETISNEAVREKWFKAATAVAGHSMANTANEVVKHNRKLKKEQWLHLPVNEALPDNELGYTALHVAVAESNWGALTSLMKIPQLDVNVRAGDKHTTPLHIACKVGEFSFVEKLATGGAKKGLATPEGNGCLHLAAESGDEATCIYLMCIGLNLEARNAVGDTPVHIAFAHGHIDISWMFLRHGGWRLLHCANAASKTPENLAEDGNHQAILDEVVHFRRLVADGAGPTGPSQQQQVAAADNPLAIKHIDHPRVRSGSHYWNHAPIKAAKPASASASPSPAAAAAASSSSSSTPQADDPVDEGKAETGSSQPDEIAEPEGETQTERTSAFLEDDDNQPDDTSPNGSWDDPTARVLLALKLGYPASIVHKLHAWVARMRLRRKKEYELLYAAWHSLENAEEVDCMEGHAEFQALKQEYASGHESRNNASEQDLDEDDSTSPDPDLETTTTTTAIATTTTPTTPTTATATTTTTTTTPTTTTTTTTPTPTPTTTTTTTTTAIGVGITSTTVDVEEPVLEKKVSAKFCTELMAFYRRGGRLARETVLEIIKKAARALKKLPNVVDIEILGHSRCTVVGDIHGQLSDLETVFDLNGLPSDRNAYLFNGDFVDRGQESVECITTLLAWMLCYPKNFHLNRGNHESRNMNSADGFEKEVIMKYDRKLMTSFATLFKFLPLAAIIEKKVFVVHGGLSWEEISLEDIQNIKREQAIPPTDSIMEDLLWSDPVAKYGRHVSGRNCGTLFGPDVSAAFLAKNKFQLMLRSHQCVKEGVKFMHNLCVGTIFSASNYCGVVGNLGGFVILHKDLYPRVIQFEATMRGLQQPSLEARRGSHRPGKHDTLRRVIVKKTLNRISKSRREIAARLQLMDDESEMAHTGTVTRQEWSRCLKEVLGVDIDFLALQQPLGLPTLGVDGEKGGPLDYMAYMERFAPYLTLLSESKKDKLAIKKVTEQKVPSHSHKDDGEECNRSDRPSREMVQRMANLIHNKADILAANFRYYDTQKTGFVTVKQCAEGVKAYLRTTANKQPVKAGSKRVKAKPKVVMKWDIDEKDIEPILHEMAHNLGGDDHERIKYAQLLVIQHPLALNDKPESK